jgi:uncharacterized membrane-anchored protein
MIQTINYAFTRAFDILLYPFSSIPPFWGILFLSILMGFVVLYIYKWVSSPRMVKSTKNQIKANILAIRLYKDLWIVILVSFFKSLFYTLKYFILNFGPILVIVPLLFPAFTQMEIRYGVEPFDVQDEMVIKASFNQNPNELGVQLMESEYFKPVMNPVIINAYKDEDHQVPLQEVNWKVKTLKEGKTAIKIKVGNTVYEKSLTIGDSPDAMSNKKFRQSSWEHFLYPVEALLPADGVLDYIYIQYPEQDISVFGLKMAWWVLNIILVVIVVLALKNRFGLEF